MSDTSSPEKKEDTSRVENHDLLISMRATMGNLVSSVDKLATHTADEFDKLWKHTEERDKVHSAALQNTTDKLAASIEKVTQRQASYEKPNYAITLQAIGIFLVIAGGLWAMGIAPLKDTLNRHTEDAKAIASRQSDDKKELAESVRKTAEALALALQNSNDKLSAAVLLKEEKIAMLREAQIELRAKQEVETVRLNYVAEHGGALTRERIAVIENDLLWMRGEKHLPRKITGE